MQNVIFLGLGLTFQHASNVTSTQTINSVEIPSSDPKKLVRETVITKYGNRNYMHLTPEVGYCFYVNNYLSYIIQPSSTK